jgi:hypothetical protein
MKHKLPRQLMTPELSQVVSREVLRQQADVTKATQTQLKELRAACAAIEQWGLPKHLVCRKLPGVLGHGIFLHPTAPPLLRGQLIGPYSGEVSIIAQNLPDESSYAFAPLSDIPLSRAEQVHFDPKNCYHPRRLYWLSVDADKKGNFTRFINHSDTPNIAAAYLMIPSNRYGLSESPLEIVYLVKRKIHPGEQLLISYDGDDHSYWGSLGIRPVKITPKSFKLSTSLKVVSKNNYT